jgi:hypothetical protein
MKPEQAMLSIQTVGRAHVKRAADEILVLWSILADQNVILRKQCYEAAQEVPRMQSPDMSVSPDRTPMFEAPATSVI